MTRLRDAVNTYPKILWFLAFGGFLNVAGLSFIWPLNSIYISGELGRPLTVAGVVLLLHSAGASIGQLTGGTLFDKIGGRPVLLLGLFSSATLMCLIGLFDSWPLYVTVMFLYGFTASLTFPALNALAAKSWPEGGRRAFNFIYVANNLGVAVGTAAGGLVASYSFKLAFFSAGVTFLLFAVFVLFKIHDRPTTQEAQAAQAAQAASVNETAAAGVRIEPKIPWVPVMSLFVGFLTIWIVYVQWQTSISVHMQENGIALSMYSLLWTINGVLIFAGQPLLAYIVKFFKSLSSQMYLGTALFLLCYAILLTADSYWVFLLGMIILTFGEMLLWPGIPAAVAQLSPPSRAGFLQGLIGSASTAGRMLGPMLGGLLYDNTSFSTLLLVMLLLHALPTAAFILYARTHQKERT
ncbi:MFS transporter [Tumebacillus sp. BK434]|uniref:MDR family MFS transporter n=1 Tax=Tumebacillus sp. BK434 TaxID=2512169 RepID=UPI001FB32E41|nr:MFS transporter [Tumebacillus sp. BK434]